MNETLPGAPSPPGGAATLPGSAVVRDVAALTIARTVSRISVLGLFVLLSYLLAVQDYGTFRQAWTIQKTLADIFLFGIPLSIYYFLPRLGGSQRTAFVTQSVLLLSCSAAALALLLLGGASPLATAFSNPALVPLLRFFAAYVLFTLPAAALEGILVASGRTLPYACLTIASRLLLLILVAASLFVHRDLHRVTIVLVSVAAGELLAGLALTYRRMAPVRGHRGSVSIPEQVGYSVPLGLAAIVDVLNVEADKLITAAYFSLAQFARYVNGAIEIPFLGTVVSAINSVLMREYVERLQGREPAAILPLWHRSIVVVATMFLPLTMFLLVFAADFIALLFSDAYRNSAPIFQVYVLGLIPRLTWYGAVLLALGSGRHLFIASSIGLVTNLVLNVLLIRWIGILGPAIATVASTYLVTAYYLSRIRAATGVPWGAVFPWRPVFTVLGVSVLAASLFFPLAHLEVWTGVTRLVLGFVLYGACVLLSFRYLGVIAADDLRMVTRALRSWPGHRGQP